MTAQLRIAVAGRFYWHNGSSHALLGYSRAAERLGYDLRVSHLGIVDDIVQRMVPSADPDWPADLLVMVCEERFLQPAAKSRIDAIYRRSRRVLIDPDGRYFPLVDIGSDANHPSEESRAEWAEDFEGLSDIILQPCLGAVAPGARRFLYFGIDVHRVRRAPPDESRPYEIVYVGNNWHRWKDIVWLVRALADVRNRVRRIAIYGQWWTGDAVEGCEEETYSDPDFLAANGVEVHPSVPFDEVEATIGRGRLSPILVRPVLNTLQLATPRMFETFAAETVPILPPYFRHASALYGDRVAPLCLPEDPAAAICEILEDYSSHVGLAREVSGMLARNHSYEARLSELVELMH